MTTPTTDAPPPEAFKVSAADVARAKETGEEVVIQSQEAVALAAAGARGLPKRRETPATVGIIGGQTTTEINPRLSQSDWFGSYGQIGYRDRMPREWDTAAGIQGAWRLGVLERDWQIRPAKGGDKNDLMVAEFLKTAIASYFRAGGGGMVGLISLYANLAWDGFAAPQPYYKRDMGFDVKDESGALVVEGAHTIQMGPLGANTISDWLPEMGPAGGLAYGVKLYRQTSDPVDGGIGANARMRRGRGMSSMDVTIPAGRLAHARYLPQGDDPAPYGIGRSLWYGYQATTSLNKFLLQGAEKAAFGIPEVVIGPDANPAELANVNSAISNLRVGALVRFSLPDGYSVRWHEVPWRAQDIVDSIALLQKSAHRATSTQHLFTGSDNGTQSLHGSQTREFHVGVNALCKTIVQTLTGGPVDTAPLKFVCSLNFGRLERYPILTFGPPPVVDVQAWGDGVTAGITAGVLTPDAGMEASYRDVFQLEEMPPETAAAWAMKTEAQVDAGGSSSNEAFNGSQVRSAKEIAESVALGVENGGLAPASGQAMLVAFYGMTPDAAAVMAPAPTDGGVVPPDEDPDPKPPTPTKAKAPEASEAGEEGEKAEEASEVVAAADIRDMLRGVLDEQFGGERAANIMRGIAEGGLKPAQVVAAAPVRINIDGRQLSERASTHIASLATSDMADRSRHDRATVGPRGRPVRPMERVLSLAETTGQTSLGKEVVAGTLLRWRDETAPMYGELVEAKADTLGDVATVPVPNQAELIEQLRRALRKTYNSGVASVEAETERLESSPALLARVESGLAPDTGAPEGMPEPVRLSDGEHTGTIFMAKPGPGAVAMLDDLRAQFEREVGPLEDKGEAHVTVLYLGKGLSADEVAELSSIAEETLTDGKMVVDVVGLGTFPVSPSSEGRTPVIVRLSSEALSGVHDRLLRRTAAVNRQRQFDEYAPHMTLGYFRGDPVLPEMTLPESVSLESVELVVGDDVVGTHGAALAACDAGCGHDHERLVTLTLSERMASPLALATKKKLKPGKKVTAPTGPGPEPEIDPEEAIDSIARTTAAAEVGRMRQAAMRALQSAGSGGALPASVATVVTTSITTLSDGVERNQAQADVNTTFGLGREQQATAQGSEKFMLSNLFESDTCAPCESLDGTLTDLEGMQANGTPLAVCKGGDLCGCLYLSFPPSVEE